MVNTIHKSRLDEIRRNLDLLGCKEGAFLKVELLFYEALSIAKSYGNDLQTNDLLTALRNVQTDAYEKTKEVCRTSQQKERLIRQFIVHFKKAIASKMMSIR